LGSANPKHSKYFRILNIQEFDLVLAYRKMLRPLPLSPIGLLAMSGGPIFGIGSNMTFTFCGILSRRGRKDVNPKLFIGPSAQFIESLIRQAYFCGNRVYDLRIKSIAENESSSR
jgi:hypothetical protein